jgi:hypothetical protein
MKPNFHSVDSLGCQWVQQGFTDSTFYSPYYTSRASWVWNFGDGDSAITNVKFIQHVFKSSGVFNVTMRINYDYCVDSVTKVSVIRILPAPKPGFTLDKQIGCVPAAFVISDTLTQLVSKKIYNMGDGTPDRVTTVDSFIYIYADTGNYTIRQTLLSPSGCTTTDKETITVFENLGHALPGRPIVTVNENDRVLVSWEKKTGTRKYSLYRSINYATPGFYTQLADTFLLDSAATPVNTSTYQYSLQYRDQCNNSSLSGYAETSILLTGKSNHLVYGTLNWNPNLDGSSGNYDLVRWKGTDTATIGPIQDLNYNDPGFYSDSAIQACYRVYHKLGNGVSVSSNSICLYYQPYVVIPTLYDVNVLPAGLPIQAFYLKEFTIELFDYTGRLIGKFNNPAVWQGFGNATQYYFYRVTGTDKRGAPFAQSGKILLIQ